MLQDTILILFVVIVVPLGSIIAFRRMAKVKRQRRPVHYFRPN